MKVNASKARLLTIASLTLMTAGALTLIGSTTAHAQDAVPAPAVPAPAASAHHKAHPNGTVASVTSTGFTVTTKRGATVTVTTDAKTKYDQITLAPVSSLTTGESVIIEGKLDDTGATITARGITVVTPGEKTAGHATAGTVAATTPALTITTADGKTITVTTQPETRVGTRTDVTASAVVVGADVRVEGKEDTTAATPTYAARRVSIMTGDIPVQAPHEHKKKADAAAV